MANDINRIGRQSEQLFNDELYKMYHLLKYLDDVPRGETPPSARYNGALWLNSKDNQLYSYWSDQHAWYPIFKEKHQLIDQLLYRSEPPEPVYGQLWMQNEVMMYFDGEQFKPVKTLAADEHDINLALFDNFLFIPKLSSIGQTEDGSKQYVLPSTTLGKIFLDGKYDDSYKKIHSACIQYPETMNKTASLVHVNPAKLKNIKKRFFKIDKLSGGVDIDITNKEFYAFKAPENPGSGKPVGGTLLKRREDYRLLTNDYEGQKPVDVKSTMALDQDIVDNYDYLLAIEYLFDDFNNKGRVEKYSDLNADLYKGYQIVPLLYPFNVFLGGANINETGFKYNHLDRVVFMDDIDQALNITEDNSSVFFGEVYEGQKVVELKEDILKLYGEIFEDKKNNPDGLLLPLDSNGNLKPKQLIEMYGRSTEPGKEMIRRLLKDLEMAVMSTDNKDVGIVQHLTNRQNGVYGVINMRHPYTDPILFLNGEALYGPLGDFNRNDNTIEVPNAYLGSSYALIDGSEEAQTQVLAYGTIGDKYTYSDVVQKTIFKDEEKLVLLGELFEESSNFKFTNGNLHITGEALELDNVPIDIPRVQIESVDIPVDDDGNIIVDDVIEHDEWEIYKDENGNVLYDPNYTYYLKIPHNVIGRDEKIIVFVNGLLISKNDIYKDNEGNIYIKRAKEGQKYLILKYKDNILFDFEMKPAISFGHPFNDNLVYIDDKLVCNSESILRDRLDMAKAVHNEIQQCKISYTDEDGTKYEADKIYRCNKYDRVWEELSEEEIEIVKDVACQYDNAISSITTYVDGFDKATVYLYSFSDAKRSSLNVGGTYLEGYKNVIMVTPVDDIKTANKNRLKENELVYSIKNDRMYVYYNNEFTNLLDHPRFQDNTEDILFLMRSILHAKSENDGLVPLTNIDSSKLILSLYNTLYSSSTNEERVDLEKYPNQFNLPSILSATYGDQIYIYRQAKNNMNEYELVSDDGMVEEYDKYIEDYLTIKMMPEHYYQPHTNSLGVYLAGVRQFDIEESYSGQEFTIPGMYQGEVVFVNDSLYASDQYTCERIREYELEPITGVHNAFQIINEKDFYPGHAAIYIDGIRQDKNAFKIINKKVIQFLGEGIKIDKRDNKLKNKILVEVKDNYNIRESTIYIDEKRHLSGNNLCKIPIGENGDLPLEIIEASDTLLIYINGILYTSYQKDYGYVIDKSNKSLVLTDAPMIQRLRDGDSIIIEWR